MKGLPLPGNNTAPLAPPAKKMPGTLRRQTAGRSRNYHIRVTRTGLPAYVPLALQGFMTAAWLSSQAWMAVG
tara:strand:+ start:383 stop:598 length:216 start_codon:yes stop_codon:yes gene_type:complete